MITVAAGDEIAAQLADPTIVLEAYERLRGVESHRRNVAHFEQQASLDGNARLDQVFDHFVLRIEHDPAAVSQLRQRDAMAASAKPEFDPVVKRALAQHALA